MVLMDSLEASGAGLPLEKIFFPRCDGMAVRSAQRVRRQVGTETTTCVKPVRSLGTRNTDTETDLDKN